MQCFLESVCPYRPHFEDVISKAKVTSLPKVVGAHQNVDIKCCKLTSEFTNSFEGQFIPEEAN